jgi:magnesium chelatase family protein
VLDPQAADLLRHEIELERLSGRGYHRIRRVARTIADLRGDTSGSVALADVTLALQLRCALRWSRRTGLAA